MVDQTREDVSVAVDAQSVAGITPDQLNQPQAPTQDGDADLLKQKLALANRHTKEAERKAAEQAKRTSELEEQLKALSDQIQQTNTASLSEQGKFKELWEQSQKTIASLKQDLQEERSAKESVAQEAERERLKNQAMAVIDQAGALSPDQMYDLLQVKHGLRRGEEGQVEVVVGGASIPLSDHLQNLRNANSGYQHHFGASGAQGMGAAGSAATVAPGMSNPFRKETFNFTQQLMLKQQNPELAAALQKEAARG